LFVQEILKNLKSRKISTEILVLLSALLLSAVGLYIFLATSTFLKDKIGFVFDLNKTAVSTIASQLETTLMGTVDKLKLFSVITLSESKNQKAAFKQIIEEDPLLVASSIYELEEEVFSLKENFYQNKFALSYNLEPNYFSEKLPHSKQIPFDSIKNNQFAVWNASVKGGPPLMAIGVKILVEKRKNKNLPLVATTMAIVGYLKVDLFLKSIAQAGVAEIFVVDSLGNLLIHPDSEYLFKNYNYSAWPIVQDFKLTQTSLSVKKYNYKGDEFLGAYARTQFAGLGVFATVYSDDAFDAVKILMKRSVIFALMIFFGVVVIASFFASSLTNPIRQLVQATDQIAGGDLNVVVAINTKNEIKTLADSFNKMTQDLKKSRHELEETNRGLEAKVKERTQQLEELATKDPLTGCYNRRFFNERLHQELIRSKRASACVGLIYMDIDHFKKYNDVNGHPGGDVLLKQFPEVVKSALRQSDVLARIGGEEFCVILPDTDLNGTKVVAEKIRFAIEKTDFPNGDKQPLGRVTCSLGVSEYPTLAGDEEALVKNADEALYIVKQKSRNAVGVGVTSENYTALYIPQNTQKRAS